MILEIPVKGVECVAPGSEIPVVGRGFVNHIVKNCKIQGPRVGL